MADWIVVGQISGLHGLDGWFKVFSYTQPLTRLADYQPLYLDADTQSNRLPIHLETLHPQGKSLIAKVAGVTDRQSALRWVGQRLWIARTQLPPLPDGEYYWADLEGLEVITATGQHLGQVDHLLATGAHDVLVVRGERERLIPFVRDAVVIAVNLAQRQIQVDWDADF